MIITSAIDNSLGPSYHEASTGYLTLTIINHIAIMGFSVNAVVILGMIVAH